MTQLALIEGGVILKTVTAALGFNLPDGSRVSPAEAGWDNGTYRLASIADADEVPEGKQVASTSAVMVAGVPQWVHALKDIPPPEPRREGEFREFMKLFTAAERNAVYAAEALGITNRDFTLKEWLDIARGGRVVPLDHPDTIEGINGLALANIITQAAADRVLGADFDNPPVLA